jgi:hypothetical protein
MEAEAKTISLCDSFSIRLDTMFLMKSWKPSIGRHLKLEISRLAACPDTHVALDVVEQLMY